MIANGEIRKAIRSAFFAVLGTKTLVGKEVAFVATATDSIRGIVNNDAPCVACAEREEYDDDDEPDNYTVKTTVYKNGTQIAASSVVIDP